MSALIQRKQKTAVCVDETKEYWLKVAPTIWPSLAAKKKALAVFSHQLKTKIAFASQASLEARVLALQEILGGTI